MIKEEIGSPLSRGESPPVNRHRLILFVRHVGKGLVIAAFILLVYGLAWNYSTRKYLKGFADAIIPLEGSPEKKSEALLKWLRYEPERTDGPVNGSASLRDPVNIVQNARLLKYCGSATNAFTNLASVAGVRTRRLLLLDKSGGAKHVLAELQTGERWIAVDPSLGLLFKDRSGRGLSKEDLRDPEVFRDAISRMPGYRPNYTFENTAHINLRRIPLLGTPLRRTLNRLNPRWEEAINWGYFTENASLWPMLVSLPLLLLGIFIRLIVDWYGRNRLGIETVRFHERLMRVGRALLYRSA